ncbi:ATP-dependent helicase [Lacisediminihabitans changchengi]|uniref:ATP-dependent helicase n=1 Tax=Lacisediminihabitans changchengi TaxID=2787634 RepID=A0A934VYV0_9MICO|nr:ATP-dependent helicase [Lacisediminihabitans changchengi]MBK4348437.1 ATP-dependent helicase [Lacisediminihabitans changchengi]
MGSVLEKFSPATREWFAGAFSAPTPAQLGAWEAVTSGAHALVVAPTGSGKTLAAFLWAIDRLATTPPPNDPNHRTRVLYISPLKALGVDVERNLRSPLVGITQTAKRLGMTPPEVTVGVRSGDTPSADRRLLQRRPPDILITTPESLYLMLTASARETLKGVDTVIIDEVHAVASTKRGAHLALSLERLDMLLDKPAQRIGLSATVRPREEVARFLAGGEPVTIVAPPSTKKFDLSVVVPVDDMTELGTAAPLEGSAAGSAPQGSIWPHVEEEIVDRILEHRSTIVFANSRRLAERLTARLNEIYDERLNPPWETEGDDDPRARIAAGVSAGGGFATQPAHAPAQLMGASGQTAGSTALLARAHHGSVSKDQRALIEDDLKSGRLRCVVATSSLELGIDMGAVDLVIQVESPPSVASGLQRIGRAGHQVGEVSRGIIFPKHRADLIHSAVASERMTAGLIESLSIPQNPLDVLAQQTVAAVALDSLDVEEWYDTVRRSAPFATLPRSAYDATLDLLSGLYPSDEFAELRPRIIWDRVSGRITGRPGAQRLAVTSGGTIPDRGMFGVFMVGSGEGERAPMRVGELDEEMVYESRVGDVFALGTTSWKIEDITHDRVVVSPAFGQPGRVPFWKGDGLGRPVELGRAVGAFTREVASADNAAARERVLAGGLDERAVNNLVAFVDDQKKATGHVPTDRTLVVERFRDELGDWRVVMHSPYGMQVHAPWALAVGARIRDRFGIDGGAMASDDGVILRIPDTEAQPPGLDLFVFDPAELRDIVTEEVGGSALFAARFRECAARALLLPRYNPAKRSPLWQQRQRASQLLDVARKYPSFPIILEAVREVLQDVYDLPALTGIAEEIESRRIRLVEVETEQASPFARSLLFGYVAAFMYEGDSPLAERRAAALSLDSTLLAELLGRTELRELLDPLVIEQTELELQRLAPDRKARDVEGLVDLLRMLGPLSEPELLERVDFGRVDFDHVGAEPLPWLQTSLTELARANRIWAAGSERWAVIEDASRLRDALGTPLPIGIPAAFVEPVDDPLGDLISRFARTHGPFTAISAAQRFGLGPAVVVDTLRRLASARRVVEGEFRPGGSGSEWCDNEVLRRLRSRSLAALRQEVEPVDAATLGRFLPAWQHVTEPLRGTDGVAQVIDQLAGVALPASTWESLVLPARVKDYSPVMLDELTASGEVIWSGGGTLPGNDGWLSFHLADTAALTLPEPTGAETTELQRSILASLAGGGAFFFRQLSNSVGASDYGIVDDKELTAALWDLVWEGLVTNDTLTPLRALLGSTPSRPRAVPRTRAYRGRARSALPSQGGPPSAAGRWSLLPLAEPDSTVRGVATAELLLERYGVVTRGSVVSEGIRGGFSLAYRVLSRFEETGRARRGYFIEGLGAAQFATGATIDRLRSFAREPDSERAPTAVTLAATDPANPYGAALAWPAAAVTEGADEKKGHRPGRKAGALVILVDGSLALYVERGGKTMLTFDLPQRALEAAASSLASTIRRSLGRLRVERVDGDFVIGTPLGDALVAAGFTTTPQGLRLRG